MEEITITISKLNFSIRIRRGPDRYGENPGHYHPDPTGASYLRVMRLVEGCKKEETRLGIIYTIN